MGSSSEGSEDTLLCVFITPGRAWLFEVCELFKVSKVNLDVDNLLGGALAAKLVGMLLEPLELLDVLMNEFAFEGEAEKKLFPFPLPSEVPAVNIDFLV